MTNGLSESRDEGREKPYKNLSEILSVGCAPVNLVSIMNQCPYFEGARNAARACVISRPFASIRSRSSLTVRVSTAGFLFGLTAFKS